MTGRGSNIYLVGSLSEEEWIVWTLGICDVSNRFP